MSEPYVRPDTRAFLDALKANPRPVMNAENIAADAKALRELSKPDDAVWVIALGHGHYDGRRCRCRTIPTSGRRSIF